jgi:chemotaxis protein MotB
MAGKGGGGAWKVAYADFVTAMMAFFMVMWLTSQKDSVKEAVAGYFRDPYATVKGHEKGSASRAEKIDEIKEGQPDPQKRRAAKSGDNTNYQFTVLFPVDAVELDTAGKESIRTFAPTMIGKLNRVEIRGHSIGKPLPQDSSFRDLWDFCYARARAVERELEARGIESDRIRISIAAANEPIAANLDNEELKLNSRVDVILLPDLVENPWKVGVEASAKTAPEH